MQLGLEHQLKTLDSQNMSIDRKCDSSYQRESHASENETMNSQNSNIDHQVSSVQILRGRLTVDITTGDSDAHGTHKDPMVADGRRSDKNVVKFSVDTSNDRTTSFDPVYSAGPHQGSDLLIRDSGDKVTPPHKPIYGSGMDPKIVKEGSPKGMVTQRGAKSTPTRRSRLDPSRAAGQQNAKKVNRNKNVKGVGTTPPTVISNSAPNQPESFTMVNPSVSFQRAFTDVQHVQLGAQILVYGSLTQGAAPDGAFMASAFGPSDGANNVWEPTWNDYTKRVQGTRTSYNASKQGPLQQHHRLPSPLQNFVGDNLSLLSQASFMGTCVTSPQESTLHISARKRKGLVTQDPGNPTAESKDRKNDSLSASDIEAKLASAGLAIAAAASVAKAAAEAAKIASNAALQAKLMADEAFLQNENGRATQNDSITVPSFTSFKGGDWFSNCSLIITAAKEASKRRVEAALAASKHAENLNSIVEAAELTMKAVYLAKEIPDVDNLDSILENINEDLPCSKVTTN